MVKKENTKIFQKRPLVKMRFDHIKIYTKEKFHRNWTWLCWRSPRYAQNSIKWNSYIWDPNMITERNVVIAAKQKKKKQIQFFEEQAFSYLLLKSKFGYNISWANPLRSLWYLIKYFWNLTSALHQVRITYFWLGMFISRAPYDYQ